MGILFSLYVENVPWPKELPGNETAIPCAQQQAGTAPRSSLARIPTPPPIPAGAVTTQRGIVCLRLSWRIRKVPAAGAAQFSRPPVGQQQQGVASYLEASSRVSLAFFFFCIFYLAFICKIRLHGAELAGGSTAARKTWRRRGEGGGGVERGTGRARGTGDCNCGSASTDWYHRCRCRCRCSALACSAGTPR